VIWKAGAAALGYFAAPENNDHARSLVTVHKWAGGMGRAQAALPPRSEWITFGVYPADRVAADFPMIRSRAAAADKMRSSETRGPGTLGGEVRIDRIDRRAITNYFALNDIIWRN